MHFSTSSGMAEEAALLESRILYPKRKQQCLQFFYKMTGSPSDRLVIWVKRDDSTGNVRKLVKLQTFQGTWRHSCRGWFGSSLESCCVFSFPFPFLCSLPPLSLCLLLLFLLLSPFSLLFFQPPLPYLRAHYNNWYVLSPP